MSQQNINIGVKDGGLGDDYFTAFTKVQANFSDLYSSVIYTKRVLVNSLSDLPDPVLDEITLAAYTKYELANDINLGLNKLIMGMNTVVSGIESLVITLSYSGTGDVFEFTNTTNRVNNLTISAPSGGLFSWSSSAGLELRVEDVQSSSARYGTFSGSSSILRFTNVSPTVSTTGLQFSGSWASVLWQVSGVNLQAGSMFDLGSAQFNSFLVTETLGFLAAGSSFITGLADSGNIPATGLGTVLLTRLSGSGTVLTGVKDSDARWEFFHNNLIKDTRPDLLLSMQDNAVVTTILAIDAPVVVAGVWKTNEFSQMSG